MAHIPLIHGPDGAKLSKRHGALGVDAYRAMGYLPAALRNYLARLGWSHGDKEFFTTEELIAAFDLGSVGRSPSRFDYAKLENVNGHYMRAESDDALYDALIGGLPDPPGGPAIEAGLDDGKRTQLRAAIPGLKERAKTLVELLYGAAFLFAERPLTMDAKAEEILARARTSPSQEPAAATGRAEGMVAVAHGGRGPRLRRGRERKARLGRSAAARGPHRSVDLSGAFLTFSKSWDAKKASGGSRIRPALNCNRRDGRGPKRVPNRDRARPCQSPSAYSCGSAIGCVGTAEASGPGPAPSR